MLVSENVRLKRLVAAKSGDEEVLAYVTDIRNHNVVKLRERVEYVVLH